MQKIYIIEKAKEYEVDKNLQNTQKRILAEGYEEMTVSDGFHTMDELYRHRMVLYVTLCRNLAYIANMGNRVNIWRSKTHSDGSLIEGWFLLGVNREAGKQITYHLPLKYWDETAFAETLEKAPEWDGHTPTDVLRRLESL